MDGQGDRQWWVEPGALLGGPFPGSRSSDGLNRRLTTLLDAGIRTFVSLMEPDEVNDEGDHFAPYEPSAHALGRARGFTIEFHRFPIPDFGTVNPSTYRRILDTIDASIDAGRPVYLHCWGGHGRTGTVVGCRLRDGGATPEGALDEIGRLRSHSAYLRDMESPQTEAQRDVVRTWTTDPAT